MPKEKPEQFFDKTSDINELASSLPKLIQASARLQAHVFNSCMKCNIEMLDFLKHRFEQDMKLVARYIMGFRVEKKVNSVTYIQH